MKKNVLLFILIFFCIFLVIAGFLFIYFQNNTKKIKNSALNYNININNKINNNGNIDYKDINIYKNNEYNFEFSYPGDPLVNYYKVGKADYISMVYDNSEEYFIVINQDLNLRATNINESKYVFNEIQGNNIENEFNGGLYIGTIFYDDLGNKYDFYIEDVLDDREQDTIREKYYFILDSFRFLNK